MKYLKIGIILIITAFSFSAFSVLPAEAVVPKDKDIKAESGQGCKLFGITASDSCAGGLICQREAIPPGDPEENNCATDVGNPTGSACEGICRVPGSAEAKFGLGTKSKFTGTGLGQSSDLKGTIANIINIVLGFLGIVAVLFILIGGFKVMTAAGNEENTESGKKAVTGGVIGLVIVFAAWAIASFVIGNLLDATEKAPPPVVLSKCEYSLTPATPNPPGCVDDQCKDVVDQAACDALGDQTCIPNTFTPGSTCPAP